MEDKLDDLITDYLADSLPPELRLQFEQRLAMEPELAALVKLERDIAETLRASTPENELRANLQSISKKYETPDSLLSQAPEPSSGKARSWRLLAAALLVATGLFFWNKSQTEKSNILPVVKPAPELPAPAPAESVPVATKAEKRPTENQPKVIANAFKPIPKLENYIGSKVRSDVFRIRVVEPQNGATLVAQNGQVFFRLVGKKEGQMQTGMTFNVLIFSNDLPHFEAFRPVVLQALDISSSGDFSLQKQLSLSPGLYYILIEEEQSGEWMSVDKFFVK